MLPNLRVCYNSSMIKHKIESLTQLEPGLLLMFSLFITVEWIAMIVVIIIAWLLETPLKVVHQFSLSLPVAMMLAQTTFMMVFVRYKPIRSWLKKAFLPVGLLIITTGPLLSSLIELQTIRYNDVNEILTYLGGWNLLVTLLIPLILIAWQYNFHTVIWFTLITTLINAAMKIALVGFHPQEHYIIWSALIMQAIVFLVVGYMIVSLIGWQRKARNDLAEANRKLAHYAGTLEQLSVSRERNRLARELHDTLAHTLSGSAVQLEAVNSLWDANPAQARRMLDQSLIAIRSGLTETRRALQDLRASPLEDLGLKLALKNLAETNAERMGLQLTLQLTNHLDRLSPAIEQTIYRIAQEAMTNIDRHANANKMSVELAWAGETTLKLIISENGQGFDPAQLKPNRQFGLQGMKERAEMIGGKLQVDSQPGRGTTVSLTVPVEENDDQNTDL